MLATGGTMIVAMRELTNLGAGEDHLHGRSSVFQRNRVEDFDQAYREGIFYRIIGTNARRTAAICWIKSGTSRRTSPSSLPG